MRSPLHHGPAQTSSFAFQVTNTLDVMAILRFFFVTTLTSCIQHTIAGPDKGAPCRFIPGDVGWPSLQDWAELNSTVGGRLIVTVPVASICHMPTYRDTECAILKEQWNFPPP